MLWRSTETERDSGPPGSQHAASFKGEIMGLRNTIRISAGLARGRKLSVPPEGVRPTSVRIREAIFNALAARGLVEGAVVVDLFAGTGAMAIEAVSQGAAGGVLVDRDAEAAKVARQNIESCGFTDQLAVKQVGASTFLERVAASDEHRFDLGFCDPPYGYSSYGDLLDLARVAPVDHMVVESADELELRSGWTIIRTARYGSTVVTVLRNVDSTSEQP